MTQYGGISGEQLRQFVARIERLEEEKKNIAEDIKEVYAEAKSFGFDVKILRKLISLRKVDQSELDEQEALLDIYKQAMGMIPTFENDNQTTNSSPSTEQAASEIAQSLAEESLNEEREEEFTA